MEIVMPKLGLTMQEGSIVRWLKYEGAAINVDEPLLEIETEKVTVEVNAPASGIVSKILQAEGAIVPVGAPIAVLETF